MLCSPKRCVAVDDQNGFLDQDEFKTGFAEHPEVCSFFKQF
jgi:hypothetical protein